MNNQKEYEKEIMKKNIEEGLEDLWLENSDEGAAFFIYTVYNALSEMFENRLI